MAYRISFGTVVLECDTPEEVLEAVHILTIQERQYEREPEGKPDANEESK